MNSRGQDTGCEVDAPWRVIGTGMPPSRADDGADQRGNRHHQCKPGHAIDGHCAIAKIADENSEEAAERHNEEHPEDAIEIDRLDPAKPGKAEALQLLQPFLCRIARQYDRFCGEGCNVLYKISYSTLK